MDTKTAPRRAHWNLVVSLSCGTAPRAPPACAFLGGDPGKNNHSISRDAVDPCSPARPNTSGPVLRAPPAPDRQSAIFGRPLSSQAYFPRVQCLSLLRQHPRPSFEPRSAPSPSRPLAARWQRRHRFWFCCRTEPPAPADRTERAARATARPTARSIRSRASAAQTRPLRPSATHHSTSGLVAGCCALLRPWEFVEVSALQTNSRPKAACFHLYTCDTTTSNRRLVASCPPRSFICPWQLLSPSLRHAAGRSS